MTTKKFCPATNRNCENSGCFGDGCMLRPNSNPISIEDGKKGIFLNYGWICPVCGSDTLPILRLAPVFPLINISRSQHKKPFSMDKLNEEKMKWVQASERLPKLYTDIHAKLENCKYMGQFREVQGDIYFNDEAEGDTGVPTLSKKHFEKLFWLDESPSDSGEEKKVVGQVEIEQAAIHEYSVNDNFFGALRRGFIKGANWMGERNGTIYSRSGEEIEAVIKRAIDMKNESKLKWRDGQCLFNALHEINPTLANKIRATDFDPFYNSEKILSFFYQIFKGDKK